MRKSELKKHVSAKDTDYYLMRLGLLEQKKLNHRALTADNLPNKLHVDRLTGTWFTIEDREVPADEAELFLETRRARAYVLRTNALIAGMVIALFILGGVAQDLTTAFGG